MNEKTRELVKAVHRLSATNPDNETVVAAVEGVSQILQQFDSDTVSAIDDGVMETVEAEVDQMYTAASVPARNYRRMATILDDLKRVCVEARKPQNAAIRPRVAGVVKKVAGLFAQVDTAEDLDRPLSEIEKAVHGMYGDQSKNSTYYFERRGKGHHGG